MNNNRRTQLLPKIILGQLAVGLVMAALGFYVLFVAQGYQMNWKNFKLLKTGIISVSAYPKDSEVFLNNKFVHKGSIINRSPYSKNLAPGYYNVRVKKEDHHTWEATFRVEAEKVTRYPSVVLFKSTPVITPLTDQRKIELIYSPEETLAIKDANSLNYYGSEIWLNGTLVTRFSNPILSISWYPDKAHIIFQQKDEIRIIDKDGSNNVLLVKLGSELPTRFTTNHKGDELYYVDRGQYYQALIR